MAKQTGGITGMKTVLAWTIGVATIALVILIMLILFGNMLGNTGIQQDTTHYINQTINLTTAGNTPAGASGRIDGSLSNIVMTNATGDGETVVSANYTATGIVLNATISSEFTDKNVNVTYDVTHDSAVEINSADLIRNYSLGATNTSRQFPVVGTIIGVALLLAILIGVLIFAITKLGGVSNVGGGSFGGGSRKFSGSGSASVA